MKTQILSLRNSLTMVLLFILFFGQNLIAQDDPPTIFMEITKLKKANDDFMDMENELVKPFVQERIKEGNQLVHALFRVNYPHASDPEYDYVVLDMFTDFGHLKLGDEKMGQMAFTVFPSADIPKMLERFDAAASNVGSDVFVIRDSAFPGPKGGNGKPGKYVVVNHMKVLEANSAAYAKMESEVFKPVHQARAKAGKMNDWLLVERVMPHGSDYDGNFLTFDVFSDWGNMVGGMDGLFQKVHPGKDPGEVFSEISKLRELTRSETWELISIVDTPPAEVTYDMVKEGTGASPTKGQEVAFNGTLMDMNGEKLFSSRDLGYNFYATIGKNHYDRYFDKGVMQLKKGGIMTMTLPPDVQDKRTLGMTGGKTAVLKVELVDIGVPMQDGTYQLAETINAHGLDAGKELYMKLKSKGGYAFREGGMNGLGYQLMQGGGTEAALYVFGLNQQNNPHSWNACDSLADGYMAKGDKVSAKKYYQMALKINPDFVASKQKLEQL